MLSVAVMEMRPTNASYTVLRIALPPGHIELGETAPKDRTNFPGMIIAESARSGSDSQSWFSSLSLESLRGDGMPHPPSCLWGGWR